jgi:hypothetical protein
MYSCLFENIYKLLVSLHLELFLTNDKISLQYVYVGENGSRPV